MTQTIQLSQCYYVHKILLLLLIYCQKTNDV